MAAQAVVHWPVSFDIDELLEQLDEFEGWQPDRSLTLAAPRNATGPTPVPDRNSPR